MCLDHYYTFTARYEPQECQRPTLVTRLQVIYFHLMPREDPVTGLNGI